MKIGLLSQWFDPEPGPASLPAVYGREFVSRGHEVTALTGFPNYPDGILYDGYRLRRRITERRDGMAVTRVALYPNHSSSAVGRAVNYASFALSAAASGRPALRDVDALWVYNSPATVALPMLAHSRWGRKPIFLHVQDLWPESLVHSGMLPSGRLGAVAVKAVEQLVGLAERRSAVIGVISRSVREVILSRNPDLDPARIVYAPNPTNEQLFRPVNEVRERLGIGVAKDFVEVMYAGSVGEVQGLDTLLDAAAMILNRPEIRITIVGDGISRERLERRAAAERLTNVRFVGRVPQDTIPELIARSDIQVVSLADSPFLANTTPSKISALLASAVPLVAQLAGDGARLIADSGAGNAVAPGDAAALGAAILNMADGGPEVWRDYGSRGRDYYLKNLSAASTASTIVGSLTERLHTSGGAK